jgi:YfiH family protein
MNKVKYHFFGKDCKISRSLEDVQQFHEKIDEVGFGHEFDPLFLNQVHGNEVVVVDSVDKIYDRSKPLPKADGLVTNIKKLPIVVITADCVPIVFYDEIGGVVGIAHAGWKGARAGVIENVVVQMQRLGSKVENMKSVIGPSIRQESYEVSGEFYKSFVGDGVVNEIFFKKSLKDGHFMFDLPGYCVNKLRALGIEDVNDDGIDTYGSEDVLFSYRRSGRDGESDCGRNITVTMIC